MKLILKNGVEIEIVRDMGIGDLVTEVTDSSSLGILFTNLTDNNLESCTIGESEYKDLHCGSIDMIPGESDVHIHLEEKDDYNAAREILNILMGGEE